MMGPGRLSRYLMVSFAFLFGGLGKAYAQNDLYLSFEQRAALSLLIDAGLSEPDRQQALLMKLQNYAFDSSRSAVEPVAVTSFPQFLEAWRGQWIETNSLSLDIDLLFKRNLSFKRSYKASTPALQAEIDAYIANQPKEILKIMGPKAAEALVALALTGPFQNLPEPQKVFESLNGRLESIVGALAEKAFANAEDPLIRLGMKTIFTRYYSELSASSKARIATALLGLRVDANMMDIFGVLLQNSGPQVQKMVQLIGRLGTFDPEISALFKTLENSVKPVPYQQVHDIVFRQTDFDVVSIEKAPLGVGTMAQVHRATIREGRTQKQVVIRFLKPGIEERVEEDHRILTKIAAEIDRNPEFLSYGVPKVSPLVDESSNTVRAELNLYKTVLHQRLAKEIYGTRKRIRSRTGKRLSLRIQAPEVFLPASGNLRLHVQELVEGQPLSEITKKLARQIPDLGPLIAQETAKLWIQEALFGSGLYHSDLHQGNFLVDVRGENVTISLMDYGMAGVVSRETQGQIIALIAGLSLEKPAIISKSFHGLSNHTKNRISESELHAAITRELNEIHAGRKPRRGVLEWTAFVIDEGLALSYDVINLNRGAASLDILLQSVGSSEDLSTLAMAMARRHPGRVFNGLRRNGITLRDMIRLGIKEDNLLLRTTGLVPPPNPDPLSCQNVF